MPIKSVIDIEVNDEQFKNFTSMFTKYRAAVAEMPSAWKNVGDELSRTGETFEIILASTLAQHAVTRQIANAEKDAANQAEKKRKDEERAARSGALHWKDMARTTRDVAGNIYSATVSLLKWTSLTTVFTGLLGAGGLFGIDRMAGNVAAGRRSSQGLGLGYGAQKAFGVNFGSMVDSDAYLGAVNATMTSADKSPFFSAGMNGGEMHGDTGQVGIALLRHIKDIVDRANPDFLSNVMGNTQIDKFVSLQDAQRIRAMTPQEFQKTIASDANDTKGLDLSKAVQNAWLGFTKQMDRASLKIEKSFVTGLVNLEGPLERVSNGFVTLVDGLSKSPVVKKWVDEAALGLEHFAHYIGTPEFQKNVETFAMAIGKLADDIVWALKKLDIIPDESKPTKPNEEFSVAGVTVIKDNRSLWARAPWNNTPGAKLDAIQRPGPFSGFSLSSLKDSSDPFVRGLAGNVFQPEGADAASVLTSGFDVGGSVTDDVNTYARGTSHIGADVEQFMNGLSNRQTLQPGSGDIARILGKAIQQSRTTIQINNSSGANVIAQTSQIAQ